MHTILILLAALLVALLHRILVSLADLHARMNAALAGSTVPPVFAASCPEHGRPLPSAGQGAAALEARS